jgi:hypothetical protein
MIKRMAMGNIYTWMEQLIKDFGLRTNNMDRASKHGQTALNMRVNI